MAVPLSPLNKREVLKTPYIQIWCRCSYIYKAPLTDRGRDVFSSISVKCLYPLPVVPGQDHSLGGLSVQYIIWLEDSRGEECGGSGVSAE